MIPAIDCLIYHDVEHWVNLFETRSGRPPTDIVLPAFVESGASYVSEFWTVAARQGNQNTLGQWINEARELVSGVSIWVTVVPTIPKLLNEFIALRDQWEEAMGDACIVNPVVQAILNKICIEVRSLGADGVAFDLTDVYPNSTSSRFPPRKDHVRLLQNTCFCRYCSEALKRDAKWSEGNHPFRGFERNLARFVLQPTAKGATPIDVRDSWLDKLDAAELVEYSAALGFIDNEDEEGRQDALKLLRYLAGRAKITANAVKRLCEGAASAGLRTSVILGSPEYDMSTNTNLTNLIKQECANEYWVPSFEPFHLERKGLVLIRFLAIRGTYYFNAIFTHLDWLSSARSVDSAEERMSNVAGNAASLDNRNEFTIGQCAQIPLFPGIDGFVGIPFYKPELVDLLTRKAADGTLPEKYKTELLSRIEAGATRLTSIDQENLPSQSNPWG
jgi:hypothetical protein